MAAEILGLAGFDYVIFDLEHGAGNESNLLAHLHALSGTTAASIVRVESQQRSRLTRVLDLGVDGIMVPQIFTSEEAGEVAQALEYAPTGRRGVSRAVRATQYGTTFEDYKTNYRDSLLGIIQIETVEALESIEAIAALDGVDVLFIGPVDLSTALGIYGQLDHPTFQEAAKKVADTARKAGKIAGILLLNPEDFSFYQSLGYQLISCGADAGFVRAGAEAMLKRLENA